MQKCHNRGYGNVIETKQKQNGSETETKRKQNGNNIETK